VNSLLALADWCQELVLKSMPDDVKCWRCGVREFIRKKCSDPLPSCKIKQELQQNQATRDFRPLEPLFAITDAEVQIVESELVWALFVQL